jgi:hypothetical protein
VNTTSQLDLHPDAESLNAFAEQALAAQEREQVLAHLAGCSRCRQVIFLAQQAAAGEETSAAQPGMWFWNWRFAWVPAAALAAALALVVTFHPSHTAPAPEMAKIAPLSESAAPASVPQERTGAGATHRPASPLAEKSVAGNVEFSAHRKPAENLALEAAPPAALPAEPGASAASTGSSHAAMSLSVETAPQPVAAAHFQPELAVAAGQQEQQRNFDTLSASADASRQLSQNSMRAESYSAQVIRPAAAAPAASRQAKKATSAASFDIATQRQLTGLTASRKAYSPTLPSGRTAVSTAIIQNLMLEIDLDGALFLSGDSGQHWEQVTRQWTGRAIEVRTKTGLNGNAAPAGGFELKNEAGLIWASADGKTWTAQ